MQIRRATLDAIAAGQVSVAFRRWARPRVRPGTRLRTVVGMLEVGEVTEVDAGTLTEADARAAGHPDLSALQAQLTGDAPLFRVSLQPVGPDPRVELRSRSTIAPDERAELAGRLDRLDRASRNGPWTGTVLDLIAANPAVRAPDLAARLGRETAPFKRDVRKLKELGLTESLEVGYRLSPRGHAFLGGLDGRRAAAARHVLAAESADVPGPEDLRAELDELRGRSRDPA